MIDLKKNQTEYIFQIGKHNIPMTEKEINSLVEIDSFTPSPIWEKNNWSIIKCDCIWCIGSYRDHVYLLKYKNRKWHVSEHEIEKIIDLAKNV